MFPAGFMRRGVRLALNRRATNVRAQAFPCFRPSSSLSYVASSRTPRGYRSALLRGRDAARSVRVCASMSARPLSTSAAESLRGHEDIESFESRPGGALGGSLALQWSDGVCAQFHYLYLRDHCHCPQCYNSQTMQRSVDTFSLPRDIKPLSVQLVDGGSLHIDWEGGHSSVFSSQWLRKNAYDTNDRQGGARSALTAFAGLKSAGSVPKAPYASVLNDDGLYSWLTQVKKAGFALLEDVPDSCTETVTGRIGMVRETLYGGVWETRIRGAGEVVNDTAFTSVSLPPHTDGCYWEDQPGLQLFHCVSSAATGGETILVDGFEIARILSSVNPEAFEFLCETPLPFSFHDENHDMIQRRPIFQRNSDGEVVGFSYNNNDRDSALGLKPRQVEQMYTALYALNTILLDPAHQTRVKLEEGDLILIDNRRYLHGRTAFSSQSDRTLRGCYFNMEDFESRLRVLAARV